MKFSSKKEAEKMDEIINYLILHTAYNEPGGKPKSIKVDDLVDIFPIEGLISKIIKYAEISPIISFEEKGLNGETLLVYQNELTGEFINSGGFVALHESNEKDKRHRDINIKLSHAQKFVIWVTIIALSVGSILDILQNLEILHVFGIKVIPVMTCDGCSPWD